MEGQNQSKFHFANLFIKLLCFTTLSCKAQAVGHNKQLIYFFILLEHFQKHTIHKSSYMRHPREICNLNHWALSLFSELIFIKKKSLMSYRHGEHTNRTDTSLRKSYLFFSTIILSSRQGSSSVCFSIRGLPQ